MFVCRKMLRTLWIGRDIKELMPKKVNIKRSFVVWKTRNRGKIDCEDNVEGRRPSKSDILSRRHHSKIDAAVILDETRYTAGCQKSRIMS